MKIWITEFQAVDLTDGRLKFFPGILVLGETREEAEANCQPYQKVVGEVIDGITVEDLHDDLYQLNLN